MREGWEGRIPADKHAYHSRGVVAHDRAALDRFYKDLLGFNLYWEGS